jgi:protocatechuate 3,4-dioxygenase beta subunit
MASQSAAASCLNFLSTDEGPFFPTGAEILSTSDLTRRRPDGPAANGDVIHVGGKVFGPDCKPLSDVSVVIWQADSNGRYRSARSRNDSRLDSNFLYFGRARTSIEGTYQFTTIMPQPYDYRGLHRARHIHFELMHPDFDRMTSEMYFAGRQDDARREIDEVWQSRDARLRPVLISNALSQAERISDDDLFPVDDKPAYRFNLRFAIRKPTTKRV